MYLLIYSVSGTTDIHQYYLFLLKYATRLSNACYLITDEALNDKCVQVCLYTMKEEHIEISLIKLTEEHVQDVKEMYRAS